MERLQGGFLCLGLGFFWEIDDKTVLALLILQHKDLMLHLEAGQPVEQLSIAEEVDDGAVLKLGDESSTAKSINSKNRKKIKVK